MVQGAVDLVVLLPQEIWLVDFKTDQVTRKESGAKAREYEAQLRLYSRALGKIYQRPVTRAELYFLTPQVTCKLTGF